MASQSSFQISQYSFMLVLVVVGGGATPSSCSASLYYLKAFVAAQLKCAFF